MPEAESCWALLAGASKARTATTIEQGRTKMRARRENRSVREAGLRRRWNIRLLFSFRRPTGSVTLAIDPPPSTAGVRFPVKDLKLPGSVHTQGLPVIPDLSCLPSRLAYNKQASSFESKAGHVPWVGSDCTRRPETGLCSLTALEVVLGRLRPLSHCGPFRSLSAKDETLGNRAAIAIMGRNK